MKQYTCNTIIVIVRFKRAGMQISELILDTYRIICRENLVASLER